MRAAPQQAGKRMRWLSVKCARCARLALLFDAFKHTLVAEKFFLMALPGAISIPAHPGVLAKDAVVLNALDPSRPRAGNRFFVNHAILQPQIGNAQPDRKSTRLN